MSKLKNLKDEIWEALPPLEELIDTVGFKRVGHQLQGSLLFMDHLQARTW